MAEGIVKSESIGVYYVQHKKGSSSISKVVITDKGLMENIPNEFKNFFQEDFNDLMELHLMQGKINRSNNMEI